MTVKNDRRSTHRHTVTLPARLTVGEETHEVAILDLSVGGAHLAFGQRLTMGQSVQILFEVPEHSHSQSHLIDVQATVRWSNREHMGIQFEGLEPRQVWVMNKFFDSLDSGRDD
ncbi:MAG: PilZ domain-containing protein [Proteobacteria bacterium]|nr:PilZ domain-containing protein [Pseudomonadota bacterium]